jgi:uncharacterized protein YndB with AHSA1/START domain
MPADKTKIVRLAGAVLILLVATIFIDAFNSIQMNIFKYGFKFDRSVLPSVCLLILDGAFVGYIVAALLLGLGLFALYRPAPLLYEITIHVAYLWAAISVLACLLVWWLPHTYPVGEVRGEVPKMETRELRREAVVDAKLEDVWQAWTTEEGVKTFFTPQARIELERGGAYEMYFMPDAPEGTRGSEGCKFVEIVPNKRLVFTWNFPPTIPSIRNEKTEVSLDFSAVNQEQTRVSIVHKGFKEGDDWDKGYKYFEDAWTLVLERLKYRFSEGPIDWTNPYRPTGS